MSEIIVTGTGAHFMSSDKESKDKVNINDYHFNSFFSFWRTVSLLGLTAHKPKPTFWMII